MSSAPESAALIALSAIDFAYPGHEPILRGANLGLAPGERLFLTGPNGAGKSTLLKIVVGQLRPQSGEVAAFGAPRRQEVDFHEVRRRAGLVFQDADDQLFCPTVAEDVAFGPLNLGAARAEALEIVDEVLAQLRIERLRDRVTHRLSGGEKRLVTLAAVLAMKPDVLLLDEPTNALDADNAARLIEILLELPQALLVVSHDEELRRAVATRSVRLTDGSLLDA